MASGRRFATAGIIAGFCVLTATASGADECGEYEDAQRASHRVLALDDFAGPPPHEPSRAKDRDGTAILIRTTIAVDSLGTGVEFTSDGRFVARASAPCVRAFLLKEASGRRRGQRDGWDLRHEQGHFDLTESYARRLEARLRSLSYSAANAEEARRGLGEHAAAAYRDTLLACQSEQDRYDRETRHGHHRSAQGHWTAKLTAMLRARSAEALAGPPR
jgi:hypothetical protein